MIKSNMSGNNTFISLIVPAYKQEKTIKRDLIHIKNIMDELRYEYEIIVVIDGMDDKTLQKAKEVKSSEITVIGYEHNHGKGHAIRYGMARSKGALIAFIDAGMDINPIGISMLVEHFKWYNADIVVGSKLHPVSKVDYPIQRKILSLGYRLMVRILFGLSVRDTQVGLKVFRRKVLEDVLPRLLVKKYAFDIEILAVAYRLGYQRIYEAPIELDFQHVSTITAANFWKIIFNMLWDTAAVFYRLRILKYYDDRNKRRWHYDPELCFKVNLP